MQLSPNLWTSTCRTWGHVTMEPAQTSTAWSLRRTYDLLKMNTYTDILLGIALSLSMPLCYISCCFSVQCVLKIKVLPFFSSPLPKTFIFYCCVKAIQKIILNDLINLQKLLTVCFFYWLLFYSQVLSLSSQQRAELCQKSWRDLVFWAVYLTADSKPKVGNICEREPEVRQNTGICSHASQLKQENAHDWRTLISWHFCSDGSFACNVN